MATGHRDRRALRLGSAITIGVAAVLAACAPRPLPPVSDLSRPLTPVEVYRIVRPGDTLYSVSWAAGVDYRELAAWNGIAPPFVIRPGQRISLVPTGRTSPAAADEPAKTTPLPADGGGAVARPIEPDSRPAPAAAASRPQPAPPPADNLPRGAPEGWNWPVRGKVVAGFSESRGLDIAVAAGTPVKSAAAGQVVYAGSGLRGYGQLVIVKHSNEYLSAYGHNRKMLVQEGDSIVAGQVIAESGSAPGRGEQVHFEIRRNGRPVDPMGLLPKG